MLIFINTFFHVSLCLLNEDNINDLLNYDGKATMNCSIPNVPVTPNIQEKSFKCLNFIDAVRKDNLGNVECMSETKHAKCVYQNYTLKSNCQNRFENCINILFDCKILKRNKDSIEQKLMIHRNNVRKFNVQKFQLNKINYGKDLAFKAKMDEKNIVYSYGYLSNYNTNDTPEILGVFSTIIIIFVFVFLIYWIILIVVKIGEKHMEDFI